MKLDIELVFCSKKPLRITFNEGISSLLLRHNLIIQRTENLVKFCLNCLVSKYYVLYIFRSFYKKGSMYLSAFVAKWLRIWFSTRSSNPVCARQCVMGICQLTTVLFINWMSYVKITLLPVNRTARKSSAFPIKVAVYIICYITFFRQKVQKIIESIIINLNILRY